MQPVCQKWCAHDCIRNQKCCDRKFGTVLKKSRAEQNSCYCPDPKPPPPTPVRPRGAARTGEGGGDWLAITSVPDAFVKFSQWAEAPWSLLRGLCWNHRFRPLCASVPPLVRGAGPLLEPLAPPLVRLRAGAFPKMCERSCWATCDQRTMNPLHGLCAS